MMHPAYRDERRRLLAQIHIARRELGLDDGTYRYVLESVTGKDSCGCMTIPELNSVKRHFVSCGWRPGAAPGRQAEALRRQIRLRAEIHLGREWKERLNGLTKKLCGVERVEWVRSVPELKRLLAAVRKIGESEAVYD